MKQQCSLIDFEYSVYLLFFRNDALPSQLYNGGHASLFGQPEECGDYLFHVQKGLLNV